MEEIHETYEDHVWPLTSVKQNKNDDELLATTHFSQVRLDSFY